MTNYIDLTLGQKLTTCVNVHVIQTIRTKRNLLGMSPYQI